MTRSPALLVACLLLAAAPASAQTLTLIRDTPGVWDGCPAQPDASPARASLAQRQEAERLAAAATQAAILGDNGAALDLLQRADGLDPASPEVKYHLARTLEELGRPTEALQEYCRYADLAGDAPDAGDVRTRIDALTAATVTAAAARAFAAGNAHADAGRLRDAETAFGQAISAAPAWGAPVHNRAVVRLALGRTAEASADIDAFVRLTGDRTRAADLSAWTAAIRPASPRAPGQALIAGLLVPGLGHFTTDRPATGALVLGVAAAAVGLGVAVQDVKVDCLSPPVDGRCPPENVVRERKDRPYLYPGIAAAAAAGILGALDAYRGARRNAEAANRSGLLGLPVGSLAAASRVHLDADGVRLELIRLRF
jgi:tetratricopeptide (TPR) repeat protein